MLVETPIRWFPRRSNSGSSPPLRFAPADFIPRIRTRLLILQPTPFCNIACDYCYLPHRDSTARMSIATVRKSAERLRDDDLAGSELTVVWHAGEPLTMPVAFYEEAVETIQHVFGPGTAIAHSVQTNGTLVDEEWCEFFKRRGFRVGVSVDGPAELHDAHRRTRSGKGTHARVVRGMDALREYGIDFHTISVVTAETLQQADAFCDFFVQHGVRHVGCNFDEAEGGHARSSLEGKEAAYARFLEKLVASTIARGTFWVRELSVAMNSIRRATQKFSWQGREMFDNAQIIPFALLTVAHDGSFSTFSPELLGQPNSQYADFVLGNVWQSGYLASASSENFVAMWRAIWEGVERCASSCSHYPHCGGGAPANKLYELGDLAGGETLYCRTMIKLPFDAMLNQLEKSL